MIRRPGRPKGEPKGYCACRWDDLAKKRVRCEKHQRLYLAAKEYKRPRYQAMSADRVLQLGESITAPLARALFFLTYLTGARISEAVRFKPLHLSTDRADFYDITLALLKKRRMKNARRLVAIPRGAKAKCGEERMMRHVLEFLKDFQPDSHPFWVWGKPTPQKPEGSPRLMGIYLSRVAVLTTEAQVKYGSAWQDRTITKPLHPHYLRHVRAAHLVRYYGFTDALLRLFFKWSDPRMASEYTELRDISVAFG